MPIDFDSAWKEAFEHFLLLLLELLFPDVAGEINWKRGYVSQEQEFRALHPEGEGGKRLVDKLLQVWSHAGDERILHAEVQAQPEEGFERRTFVYHYHADDRFKIPPEALIVLADDNPKWRPTTYQVVLKRTKLTFEFTPVKLLDWRGKEDELRGHPNVMALFVLAHLEALRTRGDDPERARVKLDLYRRLVERKLEEHDLHHWHKFLDWLLPLPRPLQISVHESVREFALEKQMPYVTFAERYAEEKGERKGLAAGRLEALELALRLKFKAEGEALLPAFQEINDPQRLQTIVQAVELADTLDDVRKLLPGPTGGGEQASP